MMNSLLSNFRRKSAGDSYGFEGVLELLRDQPLDDSTPKNMVTAWDVNSFDLVKEQGKNILLHFLDAF